jgi:hypothetical protein
MLLYGSGYNNNLMKIKSSQIKQEDDKDLM